MEIENWYNALPQEWKNMINELVLDFSDPDDSASTIFKKILNKRPKISQIKEFINECDYLSIYGIDGKTFITDLNPLYIFHKLIQFEAHNQPKLKEIKALKQIHHLQTLRILDCNNIIDYEYINTLSELKNLDLISTNFNDFTVISKLSKLEYLNITNYDKKVEINNSASLSVLKNLKVIALEGIELSDYSFIDELSEIEAIDFTNTKLDNLNIIKNKFKLKVLNIKNTLVPLSEINEFKKTKPEVEIKY